MSEISFILACGLDWIVTSYKTLHAEKEQKTKIVITRTWNNLLKFWKTFPLQRTKYSQSQFNINTILCLTMVFEVEKKIYFWPNYKKPKNYEDQNAINEWYLRIVIPFHAFIEIAIPYDQNLGNRESGCVCTLYSVLCAFCKSYSRQVHLLYMSPISLLHTLNLTDIILCMPAIHPTSCAPFTTSIPLSFLSPKNRKIL